jgi:hypothetical protein
MTPDWPTTEDPASVAAFREVLRRASFTAEAIQEAFGEQGGFTRDPADTPLYVRRLDPESPLSGLIKLFLLDVTVPRAEAKHAVAPVALEALAAMGLLELKGKGVRATVNLFPTGDLIIAADQYEGEGHPRPDYVLGMSVSTRALASITVRHLVESALDIGTGSGVHALAAAAHSRRAVGADINPRALKFAEFNALLNGIDNVEFREGSVFDPVEGERFDLIVSNPPYVVSPDADFTYRDSGLPGEGLIRRLPDFLTDGGYASLLVDWVHGREEHWSLPPRRWVEGSGCDALILHYRVQDPLTYAGIWNAELRSDPAAYGSAIDRWVDYDRKLGIEQISWGAIVLRRREGKNWVKALNPGFARIAPASHHIERMFAAQDYLAGLGPGNGLLDGVFALAGDHFFDQTFTLAGGEGVLERSGLRLAGGLGSECELDPLSVRVVMLLDGRRQLHDVMAEAAAGAPGSPSPDDFAVETLPVVARLVELGLVLPLAG